MIALSAVDIEKKIADYKLEFDSLKDDEIEWHYQPPAFVVAFVQFIDELRRVPSPAEFQNFYIQRNHAALQEYFDQWHDAPTRNWKKRALMARRHRAYPPFVRDVYFFALLRLRSFVVRRFTLDTHFRIAYNARSRTIVQLSFKLQSLRFKVSTLNLKLGTLNEGFMNPVGYIVGEVSTNEFTFVTNRDIAPPRLEYIVVKVEEPSRTIDVLAQVTSLNVSSRLLNTTLGYAEVEAILNRLKSSPPIVQGTAKVLGYLEGNSVRFPRHAATPGTSVTMAPDDLLRKFFSGVDSGIEIGTLINRDQVAVQLNPNGLRRHLAVIAQTGAGKSYTVGVILEKLLQLGGTVVVFDPNSDYVLMRRDPQHRVTSFADRVEIYRLPTTQAGRITDEEIGGSKKFTMQFSKLEVEEICTMTGIAPTSTNIRKAIQTVWDKLQGTDYAPKRFREELEALAENGDPMMMQSPGGMPRGPRVINPSIGDEEKFDQAFGKQVAEKANIDFDELNKSAEESAPADEKKSMAKLPRSMQSPARKKRSSTSSCSSAWTFGVMKMCRWKTSCAR